MQEIILRNLGPSLGWALFGALSLFLMRAFITGLIHPRITVEDIRSDRDTWKATAEARLETIDALRKTIEVQTGQIQELVENGKVTDQLLRALKDSLVERQL